MPFYSEDTNFHVESNPVQQEESKTLNCKANESTQTNIDDTLESNNTCQLLPDLGAMEYIESEEDTVATSSSKSDRHEECFIT